MVAHSQTQHCQLGTDSAEGARSVAGSSRRGLAPLQCSRTTGFKAPRIDRAALKLLRCAGNGSPTASMLVSPRVDALSSSLQDLWISRLNDNRHRGPKSSRTSSPRRSKASLLIRRKPFERATPGQASLPVLSINIPSTPTAAASAAAAVPSLPATPTCHVRIDLFAPFLVPSPAAVLPLVGADVQGLVATHDVSSVNGLACCESDAAASSASTPETAS